jgi:hypothetical protein
LRAPGTDTFTSVPSKDKETGKRLGGAAQTRLKRTRGSAIVKAEVVERSCADFPIHTQLQNVPSPPGRGVVAVESWAAGLNLRAAVAMETCSEEEAPRLVAVVGIIRELGRLKDKAARCEKALQLRRLRLQGDDTVDLASPPSDDPVAIVLFAFLKLCQLAHDAATSPPSIGCAIDPPPPSRRSPVLGSSHVMQSSGLSATPSKRRGRACPGSASMPS